MLVLFLGLFDFFFLLSDPLFKFEVLAFDGARRDLLLRELELNLLLFGLLSEHNRLLIRLQKLSIILWVELLRCQFARPHELPESVSLEDSTTCTVLITL